MHTTTMWSMPEVLGLGSADEFGSFARASLAGSSEPAAIAPVTLAPPARTSRRDISIHHIVRPRSGRAPYPSLRLARSRSRAPHRGPLDWRVFEGLDNRDVVLGDAGQLGPWQVRAAGVADDRGRPASGQPLQEREHPPGHLAAVEDVPGEHDVDVAGIRVVAVRVQHVLELGRDRDVVDFGVQPDRLDGQRVDLDGPHASRTRLGRRDRDHAGSRRDIEDVLPAYNFGVVQNIPGYGLATGPRERPERRR